MAGTQSFTGPASGVLAPGGMCGWGMRIEFKQACWRAGRRAIELARPATCVQSATSTAPGVDSRGRDNLPVSRGLSAAGLAALAGIALTACARNEPPSPAAPTSVVRTTVDPKTGTSASPRLYAANTPIPKGGGTYKVGVPYQISGRWYYPRVEPGYDRTGVASWYGDDFHGRKTANGEIYDMMGLSAAHTMLPMPCYAWVTNLENGRTVLDRNNDRGP